ncbi:hypothetical protein FRC01_010947, partial [Tulasnella sp. 417]
MTTTCYSIVEEAINALLQGPDNLTIDDSDQAESQGQYQRLKGRSDALESQLDILKRAKKAVDDSSDSDPFERTQNTLPRRLSIEQVRGIWGADLNPALDAHVLRWTRNTVESITKTLMASEEQLGEDTDREFSLPWSSPVVMGPIIVRDHLLRHISLLGEQLADTRWRLNNLVPIARIPPEILTDVFDFVLEEGQAKWRDDAHTLLTVLSPTCRHWAEIVDKAPRLWSHISPYCSMMKHVSIALDKSKHCPLTIHFSQSDMMHIFPGQLVGAIKGHARRWKVLDLQLWSSHSLHKINSQLTNVFPPRLERLQISLEGERNQMGPFEIDFIRRPLPDSFRHISLNYVGLPPRAYAELRGLRSLAMWPLPRREVKICDIIRILSECPALEELSLGEEITLGEAPGTSRKLNFGPTVRLDHLREIFLRLRPAPLHALLRNIQAENCTIFNIATTLPREGGGGGTWTEVLLTEELQPFIRTMESVLLPASEIHIKADVRSVTLETKPQDGQFGVYWRFHGGQGAEVGRWLAESWSLGRAPVALTITPHDEMWIEILPLVLFKFYSTVNLTLCGNHAVCQQAIDFLGTALCDDPAGYQYFLMPRLTFLTVPIECHPA